MNTSDMINFFNVNIKFKLKITCDVERLQISINNFGKESNIVVIIKFHLPIIHYIVNDALLFIFHSDGIMQIIASHKFYDMNSIVNILDRVNLFYTCRKPLQKSSLVYNKLNSESNFSKLYVPSIEDAYLKHTYTISSESIYDVIRELQNHFYNLSIIIRTHKQLKITEKHIGNYIEFYYVPHHEKLFLEKLKKIEIIDDIPKTNIFHYFKNDLFMINSYYNYKLPKFIKGIVNMTGGDGLFPCMLILPKSSDNELKILCNLQAYQILCTIFPE